MKSSFFEYKVDYIWETDSKQWGSDNCKDTNESMIISLSPNDGLRASPNQPLYLCIRLDLVKHTDLKNGKPST